jgi:hypothetical protein
MSTFPTTSPGQDTVSMLRSFLTRVVGNFQTPSSSNKGNDDDDDDDSAKNNAGELHHGAGLQSNFELWSFDACTTEYSSSMLLPSSDKSVSDNIFRYIKEISNLTQRTADILVSPEVTQSILYFR